MKEHRRFRSGVVLLEASESCASIYSLHVTTTLQTATAQRWRLDSKSTRLADDCSSS